MYLTSVLQSFGPEKKTFASEDLYKLNEAIFNLPEEDEISADTSEQLFKALQQLRKAFNSGKTESEGNFYYDYVALLSTMQNQHFFTQKRTKTILEWLQEAVRLQANDSKDAGNHSTKDVSRLEAENAKLLAELEQLRGLSDAIQVIQAFKLPKSLSGSAKAESEDRQKTGQSRSNRRRQRGGR